MEQSKSIDIVHDKAKDVGTTAAVSQQKMTELTEAMERISVTSKEIGQVIEEIESIASQTNLLSLNASIKGSREPVRQERICSCCRADPYAC